MAESTLTANLTTIRRWLARFLGWDRTFANWSATQVLDGADFIDAGLRLFYNAGPVVPGKRAWVWSFLRPVTTFATVAQYNTGTIAIASGVVTGTGTTFPTDSADRDLIVSGNTYSVASRGGATSLTLDDLTVTVAAGTSYALAKPIYDLPADFGGFDGPLTWRPSQSCIDGELRITDEVQLRIYRQRYDITGRPQWAALRPKPLDPTVGQRSQLAVLPIPDAVYNFEYRYKVLADALTATNVYHYGGATHSQTIIYAVLAVADQQLHDGSKGMLAEFLRLLQASIDLDQQAFSPDNLGYNGENSELPYRADEPLTTHLQSTWPA